MIKKNSIAALIIIIASFSLLGLPYTKWWFNGDDFGGLHYAAVTKNISDVIEGNPNKHFFPSNIDPKPQPTFFNVYFRPLLCATMIAQYKLLGVNGYAYFLFNVLFHTINALLLFYLLLYFVSTFPALLATFFFMFHPQIGLRFGHMANAQYYINVTLFFLIALLLKKYFDTNNKKMIILAYILFLLSIFMRETGIVIPALIPLGSYLYVSHNQKRSLSHFFQFIKNYFYCFLPFVLITIFYMVLRAYFHPLTFNHLNDGSAMIGDNLKNILGRSYEIITFMYDFYGLSWLPYGYKKIKLLLFGSLSLSLLFLFIRSSNKLLLLFFGLSIALLLWPSIAVHYSARYVYEVSPFIALLFACSLRYAPFSQTKTWRKIGYTLSSLFICLLIFLCVENLSCREEKMATMKQGVMRLIAHQAINNRTLLMTSYPSDGFGNGIAQAIWYFSKQFDIPILTDFATRTIQVDTNVFHSDNVHLRCSPYHTKNYVSVTPVENGFRFTSTDPDKIHFFFEKNTTNTSLGRKIIHKKCDDGVLDFTLIIDKKWLDQDPLFVSWDYEKQAFDLMSL